MFVRLQLAAGDGERHRSSGVMGDVEYVEGDFSVYCQMARRVGDNIWMRVQENILPNITQSGAVHSIDGKTQRYFGRNTFLRWCTPVDDTNTKVVAWANFGERTDPMEWNTPENIEILEQGEIFDRTYKDGQLRPADTEAMVGQGPIVIHAKENLATSDKGVVLFRRRIQREIRALKEGTPPNSSHVLRSCPHSHLVRRYCPQGAVH